MSCGARFPPWGLSAPWLISWGTCISEHRTVPFAHEIGSTLTLSLRFRHPKAIYWVQMFPILCPKAGVSKLHFVCLFVLVWWPEWCGEMTGCRTSWHCLRAPPSLASWHREPGKVAQTPQASEYTSVHRIAVRRKWGFHIKKQTNLTFASWSVSNNYSIKLLLFQVLLFLQRVGLCSCRAFVWLGEE